jgi:urea transport system permease protein
MDVSTSIDMVIWVAVGGRATLIGAVLGAVLVNFLRTILSEIFPETWLFFQGALFLLVVTVFSDGIIGWLRTGGVDLWNLITGRSRVLTYPSLESDPEVTHERDTLRNRESNG